jgi:hypothetical protein
LPRPCFRTSGATRNQRSWDASFDTSIIAMLLTSR